VRCLELDHHYEVTAPPLPRNPQAVNLVALVKRQATASRTVPSTWPVIARNARRSP
jgi:hypothetical protein